MAGVDVCDSMLKLTSRTISGNRWELQYGLQIARNQYPDPVILQTDSEIFVLQNKDGQATIDRYVKVEGKSTLIVIY